MWQPTLITIFSWTVLVTLTHNQGLVDAQPDADSLRTENLFRTVSSQSGSENEGDGREVQSSPLVSSLPQTCPREPQAPSSKDLPISLFELLINNKTVQITVTGTTVFSQEELIQDPEIQSIYQGIVRGNLTQTAFQEFYIKLVNSINQRYLDQGYITSQAIINDLPPITEDGTININVIEGGLAELQIVGRERLTLPYLCDRLALGITHPLNITHLEEHLRLLNLNPRLTEVEASLQASGKPGLSILVITIQEADSLQFRVGIDNASPPSIGSDRSGAAVSYGNLTGWGDELSVNYYRSTTNGGNTFDAIYQLPLNAQEGTLQLRFIPTWTRITQTDLADFKITGNKQVYEVNFRQPLWRNLTEEFALSVGFRHHSGQTFINGQLAPIENARTRSSILKFGQDYLRRDESGFWYLSSQFNWGIDILDATIQPDPIPDGRFFSWLFLGQRVQQWNADNLMIVQGELQLTPDSLLPDQWFMIGGGQSVRGYRQNIRFGDNGFRLSIEDRITVLRDGQSSVQIAPFLDMASVWFVFQEQTLSSSKKFLLGTGLGLIWNDVINIEGLSVRLDYGIPLVPLPHLGDNLQEQGFYFQVNYQITP